MCFHHLAWHSSKLNIWKTVVHSPDAQARHHWGEETDSPSQHCHLLVMADRSWSFQERCSIPKDDVWSLATGQLRSNWGQPTTKVCLCCSKVPTRVFSQMIGQFTATGAMGMPIVALQINIQTRGIHPSFQHDTRRLHPVNRLDSIMPRVHPSKPYTIKPRQPASLLVHPIPMPISQKTRRLPPSAERAGCHLATMWRINSRELASGRGPPCQPSNNRAATSAHTLTGGASTPRARALVRQPRQRGIIPWFSHTVLDL